MIFEKNGSINLEKSEDLQNHALILMDPYAAILSNKTMDMAFKSPKRHIFSFHTIQNIEIKYLFVKFFGRCAFHSKCSASSVLFSAFSAPFHCNFSFSSVPFQDLLSAFKVPTQYFFSAISVPYQYITTCTCTSCLNQNSSNFAQYGTQSMF